MAHDCAMCDIRDDESGAACVGVCELFGVAGVQQERLHAPVSENPATMTNCNRLWRKALAMRRHLPCHASDSGCTIHKDTRVL